MFKLFFDSKEKCKLSSMSGANIIKNKSHGNKSLARCILQFRFVNSHHSHDVISLVLILTRVTVSFVNPFSLEVPLDMDMEKSDEKRGWNTGMGAWGKRKKRSTSSDSQDANKTTGQRITRNGRKYILLTPAQIRCTIFHAQSCL